MTVIQLADGLRSKSPFFFAAIPICGVLAATSASAATYTDRAAFTAAAIAPLGVESFESLTATNTNPLSTLSTSAVSLIANGTYLGVYDRPETGAHATDGLKYVIAFNPVGGFIVTWTFSSPINAVGVDLTDFESGPTNPLTFSYVGGTFPAAISSVNGSTEFFGLIDTSRTFTTFSLTSPNVNIGDGVGFDRVSFGLAVPEPGTYALLISGLLSLRLVVRRSAMKNAGNASVAQ
jgi:hypothetical protein